jgi:hypothetical protein
LRGNAGERRGGQDGAGEGLRAARGFIVSIYPCESSVSTPVVVVIELVPGREIAYAARLVLDFPPVAVAILK